MYTTVWRVLVKAGFASQRRQGVTELPDIPGCYVTSRAGWIAFLDHFCHRVVSAEPQPATDVEGLRRVIK
jgi:hypothetical protein